MMKLGKPTIFKMVDDMMSALCSLNEHRIIHRDIKLKIIFLRRMEVLCSEILGELSS